MTDITKRVVGALKRHKQANELEKAQLFAHAENSLSVALFHLRQPDVNVPGATRKTVQALDALNRLRSFSDGYGIATTSQEG